MKLSSALPISLLLTSVVTALNHADFLFCNEKASVVAKAFDEAKDIVKLVVDTEAGIAPAKGHPISSSHHESLREFFFGVLGERDRQYVRDVFTKMNTSWDLITWTCGQEDSHCASTGAGAYVYDGAPEVTICPIFFSGPFQYQKRVLIHEMTHVDEIGYPHKINDIRISWAGLFSSKRSYEHGAYEIPKVAQLARYAPKSAILNADNYAQYAMQLSRANRTRREKLPDVPNTRLISPWAAWVDSWPYYFAQGPSFGHPEMVFVWAFIAITATWSLRRVWGILHLSAADFVALTTLWTLFLGDYMPWFLYPAVLVLVMGVYAYYRRSMGRLAWF